MKKIIFVTMILCVQVSVYANEKKRDSGLIFNEDSSHFFHTRPAEKMTVEGLQEHVDQYAQTQISRIFFNVNAQCTSYKSKVWSSIWDDKDVDALKSESKWLYNAALLNKRGIDPYDVWINRCHEKNISPWISIRMNDVHYNNDISHWIHSKFWREHPEYWRVQGKKQKGYFDRAFDYEHKQVRDYHMALIQEVLERYDIDGLELDWLREPYCFRPGHEKTGIKLLTEFVSQVRRSANNWAVKRSHPVKIAVRVPVHPETAKGLGLDAVSWCKKSLVDILVLSPRWTTADFDIPIELWRELLGQTAEKLRIAACLEVRIKPSYGSLYNDAVIRGNYEAMCGFSAAMLHRGADMIYLFNYFDQGKSIADPAEYKDAISNCGQMETVIRKPRRHIVTWSDVVAPLGAAVPHVLPAEITKKSSQQFRIYTGPKPTQGQVIIRVGFDKSVDIKKVKFTARLNSISCKSLEDNRLPEQFCSARVAQFKVPLQAMQDGYNLAEVFHQGGGGTQKIVWAEIYIVPLELDTELLRDGDRKDAINRQDMPRIVGRRVTKNKPLFHGATYSQPKGLCLVNGHQISKDNGKTWSRIEPKPDFNAGLPYGYRRNPFTSVVDPGTGRLITIVNAMDTPGLDPNAIEPKIALSTYYLRYRVSENGGRTWLFDEPIVHAGRFTPAHPFERIHIGRNSFYLGDSGCVPIVTRTGRILVPTHATMLGEDNKLWNPTGQLTYTDVFVIIGTWKKDGRIEWLESSRVRGDPARSTRGMIEPTLAEFADGRILMVMRGSNAGKWQLPSYRWFSVSEDDGKTWTKPSPWTYDDGQPFFSPSSMSILIKHSSGRVFWLGNICETNCKGNSPRWPVVIGQVDSKRLSLIRQSVLEIDTKYPDDQNRGRLDLSHFWLIEDRETGEFIVTYPRAHNRYKSREWAMVRIAVN